MTRTAKGLRDALFDEMDALRRGESNPARARSVAMLANSVADSVMTEIEFHKYVSSVVSTGGGDLVQIGNMELGTTSK